MIDYYDSAFKPSRFLLWLTGMRPLKHHIRPMIIFIITLQALANALAITSFFYDRTFLDIVDIIVTEFINVNIMLRLVTLIYYEKEFQNIYRDMEKLWPITNPKLHNVLKYLKYFQSFLVVQILGFVVALWTQEYVTGKSALHFYRPKVIPEKLFNIFVVDGFYLFFANFWTGFDLFFMTVTNILMVQYRILNKSLQRCIEGDIQEKCTMKICIEQTKLLKGITDRINKIYGPMLLLNIWLVITLLGMLMYIVYERNGNPKDCMEYFIMIAAIVIAILMYYVVPAQLLTNEVNKMYNDIYCTNWYNCSMPIKKSLLMILTYRKEKDAVIAAYGSLVKINFQMCTNMFRTVFSVFTFLTHMKSSRL